MLWGMEMWGCSLVRGTVVTSCIDVTRRETAIKTMRATLQDNPIVWGEIPCMGRPHVIDRDYDIFLGPLVIQVHDDLRRSLHAS